MLTSISRAHLSPTPVMDILTLLMTSSTPEVWSEHLGSLIQLYTESINAELKRLGSNIELIEEELSEDCEALKYKAFIVSVLILKRKIQTLETQFKSNTSDETIGAKLRSISFRAIELVDHAFLHKWRQSSTSQEESSTSLTLKIQSSV